MSIWIFKICDLLRKVIKLDELQSKIAIFVHKITLHIFLAIGIVFDILFYIFQCWQFGLIGWNAMNWTSFTLLWRLLCYWKQITSCTLWWSSSSGESQGLQGAHALFIDWKGIACWLSLTSEKSVRIIKIERTFPELCCHHITSSVTKGWSKNQSNRVRSLTAIYSQKHLNIRDFLCGRGQ